MTFIASHLLTLLIVLPLLGAALALAFPPSTAGGVRGFGLGVMGITLGLALYALTCFEPAIPTLQLVESYPWIARWGASWALGVDGLAMAMVVLTAALTPLALCALGAEASGVMRRAVVGFLLLEGTVLGAFLAVDLLLFYVFFEAMLVPAFVLIGLHGGDAPLRAALRFFLYTMFGSMLMLMALLYTGLIAFEGVAPSFSWTEVTARFAAQPVSYTELTLFLAFALAFVIKVPLVPFHGWLPLTYRTAPVPVTLMLSAVMVKVGAFGLLRYALMMFPRSATYMLPTLAALSVVGILYGALCAFGQESLRRVIAYSSISHMGFVVLGMTSMAPDALMGSGVQMVNHAISTGGLFVLIGMVLRCRHTDAFVHLGGMAKRTPMLATAFVFMALSSIGLPGLNGFVGEWLILMGTFGSEGLAVSLSEGAMHQAALLATVTLGVLLTVAALYRLIAWVQKDMAARRGSRMLTALGICVVVLGGAALVLPPLGGLPVGGLLRPLLPRALSNMPFHGLMPTLAVFATGGVVLAAVYLLWATERVFFGPVTPTAATAQREVDLSAKERWLLAPFVAGALCFGLYPAPLTQLLLPTVTHYAQQFRAQAGWPEAKAAGAPTMPVRLVPVGPGHLRETVRPSP